MQVNVILTICNFNVRKYKYSQLAKYNKIKNNSLFCFLVHVDDNNNIIVTENSCSQIAKSSNYSHGSHTRDTFIRGQAPLARIWFLHYKTKVTLDFDVWKKLMH